MFGMHPILRIQGSEKLKGGFGGSKISAHTSCWRMTLSLKRREIGGRKEDLVLLAAETNVFNTHS